MAYLIAAYAVVLGGVIGYAGFLAKERRELRRALSQGEESNPG